jgi:hypothetical protein
MVRLTVVSAVKARWVFLASPPVAHLGEAPQPLEDVDAVLHPGPGAVSGAVVHPFGLLAPGLPNPTVGEVARLGHRGPDDVAAPLVAQVAVDAPLGAMQQPGHATASSARAKIVIALAKDCFGAFSLRS